MPTSFKTSKTAAERKEEAASLCEYKAYQKQQAAKAREHKKLVAREKKLLKYMLKTDVLYYHHGKAESLKEFIQNLLKQCVEQNTHQVYDQYIWNYQGESNNYMPLSQLGRLWSAPAFASIYDVPLDGSYIFYSVDSGQRGLGTFHTLTVRCKDDQAFVPHVNPGARPY